MTFEYYCEKCKEKFDKYLMNKNDEQIKCQRCGGDTKKLISAPGFILKGKGFYCNDKKGEKNV